MIPIYRKPQRLNPKTTRLIHKFRSVAGYMINLQKSVSFLYTNNEILEKEDKNTTPFKSTPPKIKYLEINLNKEVKDSHAKNCKALIKETEEDVKKWKYIPCSWIGKIKL